MFKLPMIVPYAIVAFNISIFTLMLQMDWLIFHSTALKVIAWALTITAWAIAYTRRNKFMQIF